MPISSNQKNNIIAAARALARQFAALNARYSAFIEEYNAEDYGSLLTDQVIADSPSPGLTQLEFGDGVYALGQVSAAIVTNKTNLYRLAS